MKKLALLLILGACAGGKGDPGASGSDGRNGTNGHNGSNGTNGTNGVNGTDGVDASESAFDIVEAIIPCNLNPSIYKETLLRLRNGSIIASFSAQESGYQTRLITLPDGVYATTDGNGCSFTLQTNNGQRTLSWSGGTKSWTMFDI